jgi:hypothetical protein
MAVLRYSAEEYQALQDRINAGVKRKSIVPVQLEEQAKAIKSDGRRNKYGAIRTELCGLKFDSKAEAKRYAQLKAMEAAGQISELQLQVRIPLLPAQDTNGRKEKPVDYICDFVYVRDGKMIHEDTKSSATKTPAFILKRKLCLYFHGIVIREVMME